MAINHVLQKEFSNALIVVISSNPSVARQNTGLKKEKSQS